MIISALPVGSLANNPLPTPQTSAQPLTGTPTGTFFDHIVIIMMENEGVKDICGQSPPPCNGPNSPYMSSLANTYTVGSQYLSLINTSQPNYVAMISGSLQGCTSGGCPVITAPNIVDRLTSDGLTWKAYMEDQPDSTGCDTSSSGFYESSHNPFVQFQDITNNTSRCNNIVKANPTICGTTTDCKLINDLNNASSPAPNFLWLTPNNCDNMHAQSGCTNGCSSAGSTCITAGDNYLKSLVPNILNSRAFITTRSALFITFDEGMGFCPLNGSHEDCVYASWSGPTTKTTFGSKLLYNHYSITKTLEVNWNLPSFTANDAKADPMDEFFKGQHPDFFVASTPSTIVFPSGGSSNSTIRLNSLGNFSGTVSLSKSSSPSGLTLALNPTSLTLASHGNASSTLSISSSTPGKYNATVTGTSGSLSHNTTITITVAPPPDFALSSTPGSLTIGKAASSASSSLSITSTGDRTVFESSYLANSFYAKGLIWLFFEDSSQNCEHQGGCLLYTTSTNGTNWSAPTNVGVHVTDSDFSVYTNGNSVYYARYNETTFENDCGRNIQFRTGALSSNGIVTWQPEQTALHAGSAFTYPNDEITVDSNGEAWIAVLSDSNSGCGGSGNDLPQIIHSSGTNYASWSTPFTLTTAGSNNWHIALDSIGSGQIYATYWIENSDLHGRLYNGASWGGDEQVSSTSTKNDVNAWLFNSGTNIYAVYFDNTTETYRFAARTTSGTWITNTIGTSETHTGTKAFNTSYYSLPDAASYDPIDNQIYVFYLNSTRQAIDEWRGFGNSWTKTTGIVSTASVPYPDSITSFIQSSPILIGALFYTSGSSSPFTVNTAALRFTTTLSTDQFATIVTSISGFSNTVNLTTSVSPSTGLTVSCSPASISGGSGASYCSVTSTTSGTYTVTVTGKSGSLTHTTSVTVNVPGPPDFMIAASAPLVTLVGQSSNSTLTITGTNGFTGTVTLTDTIPSGLTCGPITPNSIMGSGSATVTCNSTSPENYTLTITGRSGTLTHNATATFRFQDFTIAATFPTARAGTSTNSTIGLQALNGYAGTTSLTMVAPSGLVCGPITPNSVVGTGTATVSCSSNIAGNYTLTIKGASGILAHNATATFHIQDFTVSATSPNPVNIKQSSTSTVTVTSLNHFAGTVNLTDTIPSGLACGPLTPTSVTGSGTATLSCNATVAGNYTVTIKGTSATLLRTANATFTFQDFTIAASSPNPTNAGQPSTPTITVTALNHFAGTVNLTDTLPAGLTCGPITPNSFTGSGTATISCNASIAGNYTLTVFSTSGTLVHNATATFKFGDFRITTAPPSAVDVTQSSTTTITVTALNQFNSTVSLTTTVPSGLSCRPITPNTITGSGTATLSCTSSTAGNYNVTITGSSGSLTHTIIVTFAFRDFVLTVSSPIPVDVGVNATSTVTITGLNQFAGNVTLTDTLPSGLSCSTITPSSLTGSGSATFSCIASIEGNYTVAIHATSAPLIHLANATFIFRDFTILATTPAPVNVAQQATSNITITALNHFANTINLTDILPTGLSCGPISPSSITGSGTSLITCSATVAGNYTLTLTARSTSLVHSVTIIFQFRDFTVTATPPLAVDATQSGSSTITISPLNHFNSPVTFSDTIPSGLTCGAITPTAVTGAGTATFSCSATLAGNFTVTITATSSSLNHNTTAIFRFTDFTISATVPLPAYVGLSLNSTIQITGLNRFNGLVSLTDSVPVGLTCGVITPSNVTGSGIASVSCMSTTAGNFTITITGTSGPLIHPITGTFNFQDFSVIATSRAPVNVSEQAMSTITITALNHFNGTVTLSDTLPLGLICGSVSPSSLTGSGVATVSCTSILAGNYTLVITASSASLVHNTTATFQFRDFTLTASPPGTGDAGQSVLSTLTIGSLNKFAGLVTLTDTIPAGLTCGAITPANVTGSGIATVTCNSTIEGNYTLIVIGESGSLSHNAAATFTFQDFNISVSSPTPTNINTSLQAIVTITGLNHFGASVNLTDTIPSGLTCGSLTPATLKGSGTATIQCTASVAGNYNLTITGTSGALVHRVSALLSFRDFRLTATPTTFTVNTGTPANSTLTVASLNGFGGMVNMSTNSTACTLSTTKIIGSGSSTLTCAFQSPGLFSISITATNNTLSHSASITVNVQDFAITPQQTSVTLNAGTTASTNITITSVNGFTGIVNLTTNSTACTITPSSVVAPGSARLSCTFSSNQLTRVTIAGSSSSLNHSTTVTFTVQDFTVIANPAFLTALTGSTTNTTITVTGLQGFQGTVHLSSSSTSCTLSSASVTGSGSSILSCTISSPGTVQITITGASASLSHLANATYTIQDFTIDATVPPPAYVGTPIVSSVTVSALSGYTGVVNLGDTTSTGLSCSTFSPSNVTGSGNATISCTSKTAGNYTMTVTGTSGSIIRTKNLTLSFQDFTLTTTPVTQVLAGVSANTTITLTSLNNFGATVQLSESAQPGLICGSITPGNITSQGQATIACTSSNGGNYTLTVTATSGPLVHSINTTIQVQDFTISAPQSIKVESDGSVTANVTITYLNGFSGLVQLDNLFPRGQVCGMISPSVVNRTNDASVTCTGVTGNFTMIVTGQFGSFSHSLPISIIFPTGSVGGTSLPVDELELLVQLLPWIALIMVGVASIGIPLQALGKRRARSKAYSEHRQKSYTALGIPETDWSPKANSSLDP